MSSNANEAKAKELMIACANISKAIAEKQRLKALYIIGNPGLVVATEQEISRLQAMQEQLIRQAYSASPTYTTGVLRNIIEFCRKNKVYDMAAMYQAILASCEAHRSVAEGTTCQPQQQPSDTDSWSSQPIDYTYSYEQQTAPPSSIKFSVTQKGTKYCPYCGENNEDDRVTCRKCGKKIT
jgi:hypothetical protein